MALTSAHLTTKVVRMPKHILVRIGGAEIYLPDEGSVAKFVVALGRHGGGGVASAPGAGGPSPGTASVRGPHSRSGVPIQKTVKSALGIILSAGKKGIRAADLAPKLGWASPKALGNIVSWLNKNGHSADEAITISISDGEKVWSPGPKAAHIEGAL